MKYTVYLEKAETCELYEKQKTNVMHVYAQKKRDLQNNAKYKIILSLSKNGMLGLGKELIRYAFLKTKVGHHRHLDPIETEDSMVQALGIFLLKKSVPGIIGYTEFDSIESFLREAEIKPNEEI